jgi:hypothetical protein
VEELSKKERQELGKEKKRQEEAFLTKKNKMKSISLWSIPLLGLLVVFFYAYKEFTKPLPGILYEDLGRDHVTDISTYTYNSNPPTSGPHFAVWAKKGVYDRIISDGYLIHSLEHGYIVISYNCENALTEKSFIPIAFAHSTGEDHIEPDNEANSEGKALTKLRFIPSENTSWFVPENPPDEEVELSSSFQSDSCKSLVSSLRTYTEEWERVIVVPRVGMDAPIALTAWRRLLTLSTLDQNKITEFIKSYHNLGPERTME